MRIIREIIPYLIIIAVVLIIRTYFFTPARVDGISMEPTLYDRQVLILNLYDKKYERFDIIILSRGQDKLVKRIIGLPGDTVAYKDNQLYINNKKVEESYQRFETTDYTLEDSGITKIPKDHYFVMGDNRGRSNDSRYFGVISKDEIIGKTNLSIFPFERFGFFE